MVSEAEVDYAITSLSDSLDIARTIPGIESDCERITFMLAVLKWVKQIDSAADAHSFSTLINRIKAVDLAHARAAHAHEN